MSVHTNSDILDVGTESDDTLDGFEKCDQTCCKGKGKGKGKKTNQKEKENTMTEQRDEDKEKGKHTLYLALCT